MLKKLTFFVIALCFGFVSLSSGEVHAVTAADWQAGRIIDDALFTDPNSMSAAQIQAFLNSKVGTGGNGRVAGQCDTNGVGTSELGGGTREQYGSAHGNPTPFTCLKDYYEVPKTTPGAGMPASNYGGAAIPAGAESAAQLIWDAAQRYSISPKVLLVTIQKESVGPLTTDDWPFRSQYTYAMGAHCPDSGPGGSANCDPNYAGFSIQISESAALLRYYLDNMTQSWWPYAKPFATNSILWNVSGTGCGAGAVYVQSKATAALYTYTPYQPNQAALNNLYSTGDGCSAYGNRNFWRIYNDWFGSTQFPQPAGGSLLYQASTGIIYLADGLTRYQVPDWDMMINYGLNYYPVQTVPDATIQSLADGGLLTNLIYDNNGVYLVNNRARLPVSQAMCTAWGFSCYDGAKVKPLGATLQTQYLQQGGVLLPLMKANGVLYKLSAGLKQPIANSKTLTDLGLASTLALSSSATNSKQPLGGLLLTTPGVIQFSPDPHIYYFDGTNYVTVGDMEAYADWRLSQATYLSVPVSSFNQTSPSSSPLNSWVISEGKYYIVDQGRKLLIPASLTSLWPNPQFTGPPQMLFDGLPTENLSPLVKAGTAVYLLKSGQKHYVQTIEEYSGLQAIIGGVTGIRPERISSIPQGNDALVDGSLIIIQDGSGVIYVVNNNKLTHIPSPNIFDAYGYIWGAVRSYPTSITTDYPVDGLVLGNNLAPDGTHYVVSGSSLYQLTGPQAGDFGAIDSKFTPISHQAIKRNPLPLSRFLLNTDDGRVYYASGGALHYVSSMAAFLAYGGGRTSRSTVNTNTIQSFIVAQPI